MVRISGPATHCRVEGKRRTVWEVLAVEGRSGTCAVSDDGVVRIDRNITVALAIPPIPTFHKMTFS